MDNYNCNKMNTTQRTKPVSGINTGTWKIVLSALALVRSLITDRLNVTRAKIVNMIKLVIFAKSSMGSHNVTGNSTAEKEPVATTGVRVSG